MVVVTDEDVVAGAGGGVLVLAVTFSGSDDPFIANIIPNPMTTATMEPMTMRFGPFFSGVGAVTDGDAIGTAEAVLGWRMTGFELVRRTSCPVVCV